MQYRDNSLNNNNKFLRAINIDSKIKTKDHKT